MAAIILYNAVLASFFSNTLKTSIAFCECLFCNCFVNSTPGPFVTIL